MPPPIAASPHLDYFECLAAITNSIFVRVHAAILSGTAPARRRSLKNCLSWSANAAIEGSALYFEGKVAATTTTSAVRLKRPRPRIPSIYGLLAANAMRIPKRLLEQLERAHQPRWSRTHPIPP